MAPGPAPTPEPSGLDTVAFDAVVLAGGTGERLGGVSKADLVLDGRRLLDVALEAVCGARQVVVVGEVAVPEGVTLTREEPPLSGPAAGVAAGLAAITGPAPFVLLLACDLAAPDVAVPLLVDLVGDGSRAVDGWCLADADGRAQWLLGVYRRSSLEAAMERLGDPRDRSMGALLGSLDLATAPAPERAVADIDTWADHERWSGAAPRPGSDLDDAAARCRPWVEQACAALGVDPAAVDVAAIHALTGEVATHAARPLAPVAAFVLGLSEGARRTRDERLDALVETARAYPAVVAARLGDSAESPTPTTKAGTR